MTTPQRRRRAAALRSYAAARQTVIERANGMCEKCGAVGTVAHHIYGRAGKLMTDTEYLIWLCYECHADAHENLRESRVELVNILTNKV